MWMRGDTCPGEEAAAARAVAFCDRLPGFAAWRKGASSRHHFGVRGGAAGASSSYLERSGRSEGKCGRDLAIRLVIGDLPHYRVTVSFHDFIKGVLGEGRFHCTGSVAQNGKKVGTVC